MTLQQVRQLQQRSINRKINTSKQHQSLSKITSPILSRTRFTKSPKVDSTVIDIVEGILSLSTTTTTTTTTTKGLSQNDLLTNVKNNKDKESLSVGIESNRNSVGESSDEDNDKILVMSPSIDFELLPPLSEKSVGMEDEEWEILEVEEEGEVNRIKTSKSWMSFGTSR